jgi:hypothetical protein
MERLSGTSNGARFKPRLFFLTSEQILLSSLLILCCIRILLSFGKLAILNNIAIFVFILFAGLFVCNATKVLLDEPKLRILGTLWLIKLFIIISLAAFAWIPLLESPDAEIGFDPLRYFYDSNNLVENNWIPVAGSNYQGIIYYYGIIFYLFGHDAFIPALINGFVTLVATLFLIRVAYEAKGVRSSKDWLLAFLLLIPEILLYDLMTGRESLMSVLIVVTTISAGRYLTKISQVSLFSTLFIVCVCFLAILVVRTSMSLPVLIIIGLIGYIFWRKSSSNSLGKLILLGIIVGLLALGSEVQETVGGSTFDYFKILIDLQSGKGTSVELSEGWSENSIGLLLVPSNAFTSVVFTFPRMLLYLCAPLPNIAVNNFIDFSMMLTAILNIIVFPYVLAAFPTAWKNRSATLIFHFSFWITFIAVAGGNHIIHERYRLMSTLLLFTCGWLGYVTCSKSRVYFYSKIWYGLLLFISLLAVIYKFN